MTYDPNTPQPNDTISETQPVIQGNFEFIQDSLQTDHYFNTGVHPEGVHKQCNMHSLSPPPTIPPAFVPGTDGVYYVQDGNAFFSNYQAPAYQLTFPGQPYIVTNGFTPFTNKVTLASGATATIVPTISGDIGGYMYIQRTDAQPNFRVVTFIQSSLGIQTVVNLVNQLAAQLTVFFNGSFQLSITNNATTTKTFYYWGFFTALTT